MFLYTHFSLLVRCMYINFQFQLLWIRIQQQQQQSTTFRESNRKRWKKLCFPFSYFHSGFSRCELVAFVQQQHTSGCVGGWKLWADLLCTPACVFCAVAVTAAAVVMLETEINCCFSLSPSLSLSLSLPRWVISDVN